MNKKQILCYVLLALMFIFAGNGNANPDTFIDRIFVPLHGVNWSFHYAGIILIIVIYMCFKQLNLQKENVLIQTRWRRILATIIFLKFSLSIWNFNVQIYKSFSQDLSAIYLEREESRVLLLGNETELIIEGQLKVKNCSNQDQRFYIEITMPYFVKSEVGIHDVVLSEEIIVPAKSIQRIPINETVPVDESQYEFSFGGRAFEYKLFNESSEILFKGSFDQYLFEE